MTEKTARHREKFKFVYEDVRFGGRTPGEEGVSGDLRGFGGGAPLAEVYATMTGQGHFGPHLRRIREQRGISLEQIADSTNVDVELWAAMERNDFSRWPSGIFARAFVREYARVVGIDPENAIDEFCRYFPQGDRRRGELIRAEAALLGIQSEWHDDLAPAGRERRRSAREAAADPERVARQSLLVRRSRMIALGIDLFVVGGGGLLLARTTGSSLLPVLGGIAIAYHGAGMLFLGATVGAAIVSAWLRQSEKADTRRVPAFAFPRLRRHLRAARS